MRLIDNWKKVSLRAWSIRIPLGGAAIIGLLEGLQMLIPALSDDIPRGTYALICIAVGIATPVARVIDQDLTGKDPDA